MRRVLPLLLAAAALAGCRQHTVTEVPRVSTARLEAPPAAAEPWRPEARYEEIGGPWRVAHGQFEHPVAAVASVEAAVDPFAASEPPPAPSLPSAPPPVQQRPPGPKLAVPRRRAREEARPVGEKATRPLEQLAREHFLDYPTRIKARKITLYVPRYLVPEARISGDDLSPLGGGRRQAVGNARLTLRELTLEGERVSFRVRDDDLPDVQIMARGNVSFVADVRSNVLRHEGLRSLLVTNDQVVPLR